MTTMMTMMIIPWVMMQVKGREKTDLVEDALDEQMKVDDETIHLHLETVESDA